MASSEAQQQDGYPTAVVTGAGGLIGSALVAAAPRWVPGWRVLGLTRADLDLTDFAAVRQMCATLRPSLIIHCAALSRTPDCQQQPALARRLNVEVTEMLAELARDIPFVFFSSDLVFDGRKGWYDEADVVNPLNVYAETKVAAERIVLENPRHTVIRPALVGGVSPTGDRGFNEALRRAWAAGQSVTLFTDEYRTPTPAPVLARAVWELLANDCPGLYHLAGSERLSRWQAGQLVAARWPALHPKITAGSQRDYRGGPRPQDTSLNCAKLQKLLSFPLPGLTEWLAANPDEPF
ncbi:SDR family oxidoreductase [Nitrospira sp. Kam-Ns4a]